MIPKIVLNIKIGSVGHCDKGVSQLSSAENSRKSNSNALYIYFKKYVTIYEVITLIEL